MLLKKSVVATSVALGLFSSLSATAGGIYDPRSLAMGGVGVTTATSRNASFFNPAALAAAKESDDFAFNLNVAVRAADTKGISDQVDTLQKAADDLTKAVDEFDTAYNSLQQAISSANTTQISTAAGTAASKAGNVDSKITPFNNELSKLDNKPFELGVFAGVIVAIPSKSFGIGLFAGGHADVGLKFDYQDATNVTTIQNTVGTAQSDLDNCALNPTPYDASLNPTGCRITVSTSNPMDPDGDGNLNFNSRLVARGAAVTEAGVSLARRFPEWGNIDIGITPKAMTLKTVSYAVNAQKTDDVDLEKGTREKRFFSFDVGATKSYGESYKAGFVIKNVLGKELVFANPNTPTADSTEKYKVKPQARLGVSHHTSWTTVGLDVDLTKAPGLGNDFSKESKYLGIGAELDLSVLDIRLGYKHDLTGNYDDMPSVGLGLYLFGLHIDAAVAGTDKNAAASVQIGLNF